MKNKENLYTPNCIRTVSGKYVNIINPDPDTICIEDIAHALGQLPRFGGHLHQMYSVAQHSVACCVLAPIEHKLEALLHDASEAYMLDMPKPIKNNLPDYQKLEKNLQRVICDKFEIPFPISKIVKEIDKKMLEMEWDVLMLRNKQYLITCENPYVAKKDFLTMYNSLTIKL